MKDLVVLVLAGGSGSRFWPLTTDKILFPFMGKPLAAYSVGSMLPDQMDSLVVVANAANRDPLARELSKYEPIMVDQKTSAGMADAIMCAGDHLRGKQVLILIADDVLDPSLVSGVLETAKSTDTFGVLAGKKVSEYFPGGYLVMEGEKIVNIMEKPDPEKTPSDYVTVSCHYFRDADALLQAIENTPTEKDDVYEQAIASLMRDREFRIAKYEGVFQSLKYPWHVLDMMDVMLADVKEYRGQNVHISEHAVVSGDVYIGNNVKIYEHSKIMGPCYIGDNTVIGNNALVRESIVGSNCVVGFGTEVARSWVGHDCWFHTNYVGDSVLEENVSMGSGTVLANLRLDEGHIHSHVKGNRHNTRRSKFGAIIGKHVRIGVNASIMPGVKIGRDSHVGAGVVVYKDIPDASFCMSPPSVVVTQNTRRTGTGREQFRSKLS